MIRCLSYLSSMSDIANKKESNFSSYNNVQYCFRSARIKESGGSFSDNYYQCVHKASVSSKWKCLPISLSINSSSYKKVLSVIESGFQPGFEKWASIMCYRACSHEQLTRKQREKIKQFSEKVAIHRMPDTHLAKRLPCNSQQCKLATEEKPESKKK